MTNGKYSVFYLITMELPSLQRCLTYPVSSRDPSGTGKLAEEPMFNNLIESTSHAREFKRRGSFLLFTTGTYLVLFVITGVASIYAYDAHLEAQSTELEVLMFVPPPAEVAPQNVIFDHDRPTPASERAPTESMRTEMMSSTSDPTRVPPTPGIVASPVPP